MTLLSSKKYRGFNLIEAAIVLGVAGLVVAGIWVAAAAISERREINNTKQFILYAQGLALKYRQNYPLPSTSLNFRAILPTNEVLPGNFRLYQYAPTSYRTLSETNKVYMQSGIHNVYSQDGYNVGGSFNWVANFVQDGRITSYVYLPRPGVCMELLSWVIGHAAIHPVLLGYADISSPSTLSYWDARTGAAPPPLAICNTVVSLDVFIW